jgi:putative hemolysin
MNDVVLTVVLISLFILVGGVFAAAEMALVSLRESQVKALAQRGKRGRVVARLHASPNRFLSAVQVGVTLAGFLSAAFGGATLATALQPVLQRIMPLSDEAAGTVALVLVTVVISYVSIVLGELVSKRLALQRAETFALALAPLVNFIAAAARPVIWLLGVSTNLVVRLLGGNPHAGREEVTEEEIRAMVLGSSTLPEEERRIVSDVFAAGDRRLGEVMLPRTEVDFLPGSTPAREAVQEALNAPHSRYPVTGDSVDDVLGFVHVRDLLDPKLSTSSIPIAEIARPVLTLPITAPVLRTLTDMRRAANHLAVVVDEYGGVAGIVTIEDLIEELIGDITDEYDVVQPDRTTPRGDQILDGLTSLEDIADKTGLVLESGPYNTLAGYVMARSGRIPSVGARLDTTARVADDPEAPPVPVELTVTEVDGRRISAIALHRDQSTRSETPGTAGAD